jgi:hypothetical protein
MDSLCELCGGDDIQDTFDEADDDWAESDTDADTDCAA